MDAVISGHAGVALVLDDAGLASIHVEHPEEVIPRQEVEIHLLFHDAKDLQFLANVDLEQVRAQLNLASAMIDALHLALIILDRELSEEARREAALELDELINIREVADFLERVLYAHPLPKSADLVGSLNLHLSQASKVRDLLLNLEALQNNISEVCQAWEAIPAKFFDRERDRSQLRTLFAREGIFKELVVLREKGGAISSFLPKTFLRLDRHGILNYQGILNEWLIHLRETEEPIKRLSNKEAGNLRDRQPSWRKSVVTPKITIVGAGLGGSILGIYLARRGYEVHLFERRGDLRKELVEVGRSIKLTLAERGLAALRELGLEDEVQSTITVPLRGRAVHPGKDIVVYQPYGKNDQEVIYSFSRNDLNAILLNAAEREKNVHLHFNQRCTGLEKETATAIFQNTNTGEEIRFTSDLVVGADGAYSIVRQHMQRRERADYRQDYIPWGYKEITIRASAPGLPPPGPPCLPHLALRRPPVLCAPQLRRLSLRRLRSPLQGPIRLRSPEDRPRHPGPLRDQFRRRHALHAECCRRVQDPAHL